MWKSKSKYSAPYLLAVAILFSGCGYDGPKMSVADLNTALQNSTDTILVLDVRPPVQYRAGHIRGAVNVPLELLDAGVDPSEVRDRRLVVICTCGKRALEAVKKLEKRGVESTLVVGGYLEWEKANYPLQRGQQADQHP